MLQKWTFKTGDAVICTPALAEDGTIYVGSTDCRFYALNPDGKKKWEFDTNMASSVNTSLALGKDGDHLYSLRLKTHLDEYMWRG